MKNFIPFQKWVLLTISKVNYGQPFGNVKDAFRKMFDFFLMAVAEWWASYLRTISLTKLSVFFSIVQTRESGQSHVQK